MSKEECVNKVPMTLEAALAMTLTQYKIALSQFDKDAISMFAGAIESLQRSIRIEAETISIMSTIPFSTEEKE